MSTTILKPESLKFRNDIDDLENIIMSEMIIIPPLLNNVYDSDHDDEIAKEPSDDTFEFEEAELHIPD